MNEMMTFPDTWEEFEKSYGFTDNEEVYTNGARLIPSFRVKQWLDHLPSVQSELANNLPKLNKEIGECNDCIKHGGDWECDKVHCHKGDAISRQAAIDGVKTLHDVAWKNWHEPTLSANVVLDMIRELPSARPERMVLPEICILEGYDTVEDENGNRGFGVYIPSEKQIYVAGDVPQEIMLKALFHELTHWVQDMSGIHFDEDEANLLAERVYEALPHDRRGDSDDD